MDELFRKLLIKIRDKAKWSKETLGFKCEYKDGSHIGKFENGKTGLNKKMMTKVFNVTGFELTGLKGKFKDGEEMWIELKEENGEEENK